MNRRTFVPGNRGSTLLRLFASGSPPLPAARAHAIKSAHLTRSLAVAFALVVTSAPVARTETLASVSPLGASPEVTVRVPIAFTVAAVNAAGTPATDAAHPSCRHAQSSA